MDFATIWTAGLTLFIGLLTFLAKEKFAELKDVGSELKRVERLLNITREESHRDFVTKTEVDRITNHIDQRFNRLEAKIDQLIQAGK
jgi:hypothetical protein